MTTTATKKTPQGLRINAPARRQLTPWIVVGVLLIVGCSAGFALIATSREPQSRILVVNGALPAGHVIRAGDLRVVRMSVPPGMTLMQASRLSDVVGRTTALPLSAGSTLTSSDLGAPGFPQPGQGVVAVAAKPGQYPPGLAAGARIAAITAPADTQTASTPSPAAAEAPGTAAGVVTAVRMPADERSPAVFSIQMSQADAQAIAVPAAEGKVSLVLVNPQAETP